MEASFNASSSSCTQVLFLVSQTWSQVSAGWTLVPMLQTKLSPSPPIFNTPPFRVILPMAKLPGFSQASSPAVSSFAPPLRVSAVLSSQMIFSFALSSTSCSATVNDDTDWRLSVLSSRRSSSTVKAASLPRLRLLSSSRSVPLSVRLPPVLLKLPPSARVLSCKLTVAPLIDSPSPKVNVPPVEEIVVPLLKLTVPTTVRSAVCVAKVPGGDELLSSM